MKKKLKKKMKTHLVVMAMQTECQDEGNHLQSRPSFMFSICVMEETGRQGEEGRGDMRKS
jgi:hypothetical protein